jgi:hypothetical protein
MVKMSHYTLLVTMFGTAILLFVVIPLISGV